MRIGILLGLILLLNTSTAQVKDFGFFAGGSYYIGDLNPYKHFYGSHMAYGGVYRSTHKNKRVAFRFHLMYGHVSAADNQSNDAPRINRNLNFQSEILEIGPLMEINFLEHQIGDKNAKGTPYLFWGLTYFRMNPMGSYDGGYIELHPLSTEGHKKADQYKLDQLSVPLGLGLKVNLGKKWCFAVEYGVRKTFTDYLDDVSSVYPHPDDLSNLGRQLSNKAINTDVNPVFPGMERGNSSTKDWYMFTGIILSFKVGKYSPCPEFH